MTNQHSVTALSDLIEQLESDIDRYEISTSEALARAYAAGADQQLEQDAKWLDHNALNEAHLKTIPVGDLLKEAMRPKPPSLKEKASQIVDCLIEGDCLNDDDAITLLQVVESLPSQSTSLLFPVSIPSCAAKAAIEAYIDENCGDEMMPSEVQALASSLRAVALYLSNDCQELISIAYEIEHQ